MFRARASRIARTCVDWYMSISCQFHVNTEALPWRKLLPVLSLNCPCPSGYIYIQLVQCGSQHSHRGHGGPCSRISESVWPSLGSTNMSKRPPGGLQLSGLKTLMVQKPTSCVPNATEICAYRNTMANTHAACATHRSGVVHLAFPKHSKHKLQRYVRLMMIGVYSLYPLLRSFPS